MKFQKGDIIKVKTRTSPKPNGRYVIVYLDTHNVYARSITNGVENDKLVCFNRQSVRRCKVFKLIVNNQTFARMASGATTVEHDASITWSNLVDMYEDDSIIMFYTNTKNEHIYCTFDNAQRLTEIPDKRLFPTIRRYFVRITGIDIVM